MPASNARKVAALVGPIYVSAAVALVRARVAAISNVRNLSK